MNVNIKRWFARNGYKVTWFIIGMLVTNGLTDLFSGLYISALISFGFAYLNYILNPQ